MVAAALGGVGLAQVPEPTAREHIASHRLEEVLAGHASSSSGLFLYFPARAQVMPKLRAFIEHVKAYAAAVLLDPPPPPAPVVHYPYLDVILLYTSDPSTYDCAEESPSRAAPNWRRRAKCANCAIKEGRSTISIQCAIRGAIS
ncbi:hypothetical protein HHL11_25635 [Ramlibacter sp. G-1-2-2]|uniref:LysR substrate-binding domain-containing protein n=1 Tax=Ramlibacter agri TaxID=2728837 RepID=A0A848H9I5_9BURK|nr:LysR substrate-binding domain-containing protein [Ramlibacter agri]NML47154.1 hypothetical protein [Ramlibacter agri]